VFQVRFPFPDCFIVTTWVVAYDVSIDRRRTKIAKLLAAKGVRLQKSVFLVQGPPRNVARLIRELAHLIDMSTDRVCAWPLTENWKENQLCFPADTAPLQDEFIVL
jgi:CRISPR-associated endonuclease Cas2